ncbi:hypothetical protein KP509_13G031800 [Ceratopteris richardii]|uniref:Pentatricopeptide repeat-containing protein n=1 Tax=Ceratopteris richardii TaxID=49495 RepID=A0A8T2TCK8_CERRI|nr:hypothetical protein KP509_13G031800 [Ceratopteris richardii]
MNSIAYENVVLPQAVSLDKTLQLSYSCNIGVSQPDSPLDCSEGLLSLEKYASILQKCRKEKNLAFANLIHTHLCGNGLEAHESIGNHLVPMYVECGSAINAQQVFNRISHLNEFSWTALIEGYIENGNVDHAFRLYDKMKKDQVAPSKFTYMALLKACIISKSLEKGREIHVAIVEEEYETDRYIGSSLLSMYAKCGSLIEACDTFQELLIQDVVSWTVLISAYVDQGLAAKAFETFQRMLYAGMTPDRVTYIYILKACGMLKSLIKGRNVHNQIRTKAFRRDVSIVSALIDMYAKCGALSSANEVLEELSSCDVAAWNILMAAYVDQGLNIEALNLYRRMQKEGITPDASTFVCSLKACIGCQAIEVGIELHKKIDSFGLMSDPFVASTLVDMYSKFGLSENALETFNNLPRKEVVSWTALISGYSDNGLHEQALSCFKQMQADGTEPDSVTFLYCLRSAGSLGLAETGQELHYMIAENGFDEDQRVGSSLVTMYVKCGLIAEAQDVFSELQDPDLVSWTALVTGYAELGHGEAALDIFQQMQEKGMHPDTVTFVSVLKACSTISSLNHGRAIHFEVIKEGFEESSFIANSLMDLYIKCGCLSEACDVFAELKNVDDISWAVLIKGHIDEGFADEALTYYRKMQLKQVSPDSVSFSSALRACGELKDLENGYQIHYEIVLDGFEKDALVSSNLVAMYAKKGQLEEAEDTYSEHSSEDSSIWNALVLGYIEQCLGEKALAFLKQNPAYLNDMTCISSLKVCSFVKALSDGQLIHIEVVKSGFEDDHFIGNALVDFYFKCGLLPDAQRVFDKLYTRDVALWNTLVAGYAESYLDLETLECLDDMQDEGISPNASTYTCIATLCGNVGIIYEGQQLHQKIVIKGIENSHPISTALLTMYAKCGLLAEAQAVFDHVFSPDVFCWNALIAGYAEYGYSEEVLNCLGKMKVPANAATYLNCIKASKTTGSLQSAYKVHALIIEEGFEEDAIIGSALIDMYSSCCSMLDANEIFEELAARDVFSWTALMTGYIEQGSDQEALNCYEQMLEDGLSTDLVTTVCSLQACANLRSVKKVLAMHLELSKKGYEQDASVGNHLVQTYAKCMLIPEAQKVFDSLSDRSVVSWTALITAYSDKGLYHEVLNTLEKMESDGISSDAVTFISSFRAIGSIGDLFRGQTLHMFITKKGLDNDPCIGNALVGMYTKCNLLEDAHHIFDTLAVQDVVSWTALIGGLSEKGICDEALEFFHMMQFQGVFPDAVSWNAVISAFVEQEESDRAHIYFKQMQEQGLMPTIPTFLSMIKACGSTASLDTGRRFHSQLKNIQWEDNEAMLMAALIDMYGKCGYMAGAQQIFNDSPSEDGVIWNALISGYTGLGQDQLAFYSLKEMMNSKITKPDEATFVIAITMCTHVGSVESGLQFFESMSKDYNIQPTMKHYNCLLDLLGRAGRIHEAVLTIAMIPFEVDTVIWSTILSACYKWGNIDLGKHAFQHAMRNDELAATFILMSNISVHSLKLEEDESITFST